MALGGGDAAGVALAFCVALDGTRSPQMSPGKEGKKLDSSEGITNDK